MGIAPPVRFDQLRRQRRVVRGDEEREPPVRLRCRGVQPLDDSRQAADVPAALFFRESNLRIMVSARKLETVHDSELLCTVPYRNAPLDLSRTLLTEKI